MKSQSLIKQLFILLLVSFALSSCRTSKLANSPKPIHFSSDIENYASKLGITLTGSENQKLIAEAASWIGTPYQYAGCTKEGTDCSCLIWNIYKNVYNKNLSRSSAEMFEKDVTQIDMKEVKEGDLIFFKISSDKPSHVGVYLKDGKFVHASTSKGVMTSSITEIYWVQHFLACGRVAI